MLGTSWYGDSPIREQLLELVGRQLLYGVLLTFGLGFGLWLLVPLIDNWAHVGGFVTGLLIAGATPNPIQENRTASVFGAVVAGAAIIAAISWMTVDGDRALETAQIDLARNTAARLSQQPQAAAGDLMYDMTTRFIRAGEADEGLDTLTRLLDRTDEVSTVGRVAMLLASDETVAPDPVGRAALIAAERWVELTPDEPMALNFLAWQLVQGAQANKDPERAVQLSRQSLDRLGDDDLVSRSAYLDTLAESLYQLGDYTEAETAQLEAVKIAEETPPTFWERVGLLGPMLPLERDDPAAKAHSGSRPAGLATGPPGSPAPAGPEEAPPPPRIAA